MGDTADMKRAGRQQKKLKPNSRPASPAIVRKQNSQIVPRELENKISEDSKLLDDLNSAEDLEPYKDVSVVIQLLRLLLNKQDTDRAVLIEVKEDVDVLKKENSQLKQRMMRLDEDHARLEQYSRKAVMIMSGVEMPSEESPQQLAESVLGLLNPLINNGPPLTVFDLVAIHRNGRSYKQNRPPSITVKFIRYYQKEQFFNKIAKNKLKAICSTANYFHNMCKYFIDEQDKIRSNPEVKWVRYDGDRRGFTVCLANGNFVNFVQSNRNFVQLLEEQDI